MGTNRRPGQALALIVGAGGMGMALARRLGERYQVLLADRDQERLGTCAAALHGEGHVVHTQACDVTDAGSVADLAERASRIAPLRALVHVVGLSPSMGDFRTLMTVNLIGARHIVDAIEPLAVPGTAAVFVASIAPHATWPSSGLLDKAHAPLGPDFLDAVESALDGPATPVAAYCLSKAAIIQMCERRAAAWGKAGARICSVSPGLIATPMGALEFTRTPAKFDMLDATPLRREGTMIEIADAVDFLVSDRASFISGIDLRIDGGLIASSRNPAFKD